jgi:hypothetical protein
VPLGIDDDGGLMPEGFACFSPALEPDFSLMVLRFASHFIEQQIFLLLFQTNHLMYTLTEVNFTVNFFMLREFWRTNGKFSFNDY